jgi:hypothetical protein
VALAAGCVGVVFADSRALGDELMIGTNGHHASRLSIVAFFVTLATAVWALGVVAIAARRGIRWWLAAVATASVGTAATVHDGAGLLAEALASLTTKFPSVDFGISSVPGWTLVVVSMSMVSAAAVLVIPLRRFCDHPVAYALALSVPLWAALLVWVGMPHAGNRLPNGLVSDPKASEILTASPSANSLKILAVASILAAFGGLRLLTLLGAAEVADANATVARQATRWPRLGVRAVVATLALAKLAFLLLGYAGVFGSTGVGDLWDRGWWPQWTVAVVLVVAGALAWRSTWIRPLSGGRLRSMIVLLVVGFGAAEIASLAIAYFQGLGALFPGRWRDTVTDLAMQTTLDVARFSTLVTVVVAGVIGLVALPRGRRTDAAVLGVAACAVALPVVGKGEAVTRSLVSSRALDVAVTAATWSALLGASALALATGSPRCCCQSPVTERCGSVCAGRPRTRTCVRDRPAVHIADRSRKVVDFANDPRPPFDREGHYVGRQRVGQVCGLRAQVRHRTRE